MMSPILFNLYINRRSTFCDVHSNPLELDNCKLNCLSLLYVYADAIVLMSTTANGLQNYVDKLNSYHKELDLRVNMDKKLLFLVQLVSMYPQT